MLAGLFARIRTFTSQIDQTLNEAMKLMKNDISGAPAERHVDMSGAFLNDISGVNMRITFDASGASGISPSWVQYDVSGSRLFANTNYSVPFDISGQNYTWTTDASGSRAVYLPQTNNTTYYGYTATNYGGNTTVSYDDISNLTTTFSALDVSGAVGCAHTGCECVCVLPRVPTATGDLEDACPGGVCPLPGAQQSSLKETCCVPLPAESQQAVSNTIDCECPTSPVCGGDVVVKGGCPCYPDAESCPASGCSGPTASGSACCSNDIEEAGLIKTD